MNNKHSHHSFHLYSTMARKTNHSNTFIIFSLSFLLLTTTFSNSTKLNKTKPSLSDPTSLIAFKLKADPNNHLNFTTKIPFCNWQGVECNNEHRVIRLVLRNLDLAGVFPSHTLSNLDQLRVLSLQNNSLTGTIPNLSGLFNLKSLFLDNNYFTGSIPFSIFSLHRLKTLDFSHNNLSGNIPTHFVTVDRLYYLRLSFNSFNGSIPPFNQSSLKTFDVSGNNLSGAVPLTTALSRFQPSSFALNPNLCGEIIRRECRPSTPFFAPATPPTVGLNQSAKVHGLIRQPYGKKHDRRAVIIGFSTGIVFLLLSLACFAVVIKTQRNKKGKGTSGSSVMASDTAAATVEEAVVMQMEQERELEQKVKRAQVAKSGSLIFCAGESQVYTLDQLMKGSAELLGRGCLGTTYKAVLDNRLIVTVKRLDCGKMGGDVSKDVFERHMESVGGLRHPNLVAVRAYFQANQERLIIYDYQPNGSLFSLIHGSRSSRARPLHWTSCLKIAEDVAQGLSYIHQAWRLVHGNLKSTNVLLGPDFEACVTDYCLSVLANPSTFDEVGDSAPYRAPETRNPNHQPTPKSDVFAYGILLLELLTGKYASELPFMVPGDMSKWVRSIRDDNGSEDNRMDMLLQVATTCSLISPEQRPTMWQVLKMLQEIKEIVLLEDSELDLRSSSNAIAMS